MFKQPVEDGCDSRLISSVGWSPQLGYSDVSFCLRWPRSLRQRRRCGGTDS